MRPLHDLHSMAFSLEYLIQADVENLTKYRKMLNTVEDNSGTTIIDILDTLKNLEYDVVKYKEWAEREAEKLPES